MPPLDICHYMIIEGHAHMCGCAVSAAAGGGGGTSTGAAIYFYSSCGQLCSVLQSVFNGNSVTGSDADGAAVYADTPGNLTITNNVFDSNTAGLCGLHIVVSSPLSYHRKP